MDLKDRTKKFAVDILSFVDKIPNNQKGRVISNQIIRSATSVGANYRAVCRARSDREFISKMNIVLEEADETLYWLEILEETKMVDSQFIETLKIEADELVAIFVSSLKSIKKRIGN